MSTVRDHILKVCEHDILQTACGNVTKFTTNVQSGTKMNWLDFEIQRSKVKVTTRPNMVNKTPVQKCNFLVKVDESPLKTIQLADT